MATVTYKPPAGGPSGPLEIRFDSNIYTLEPGVPMHVPEEQRAGVAAALQAAYPSMTSPVPTVVPGTTGAVSTTYQLVANNGNGDTLPGTTTNIANGAVAPNNTISWAAPYGATQVKVIRTLGGATQGLIATVPLPAVSFVDAAAVASVYTPAGAAVSVASAQITNPEQ